MGLRHQTRAEYCLKSAIVHTDRRRMTGLFRMFPPLLGGELRPNRSELWACLGRHF